jgi:hypothetical protein
MAFSLPINNKKTEHQHFFVLMSGGDFVCEHQTFGTVPAETHKPI